MKQSHITIVLLLFFLFSPQYQQAQENLLSDFESYSKLPREVLFVHLNKSVYIKGENIGFSAYVLDKANKKTSQVTSNLYCKILDKENHIIKQQLLKVDNGIASGLFEIDSLFTSGEYTLLAFTNWMRNFSEKNHFEQRITIIDPEETQEIITKKVDLKIDAQFLPESGQAVVGFENVFGVIIKNNFGFGLPNVTGNIIDSQNNIVSNFKTNQFGIGQFILRPQKNESYSAQYNINNKLYKTPIDYIKVSGQTMRLQNLREKIGLTISNSEFTLLNESEKYYLTIHNGDSIKSLDINFADENQILKIIPKNDLYQGINIITLFNSSEKPILERLFFNFSNIDFQPIKKVENEKAGDSLSITLAFDKNEQKLLGNLSISVLPNKTISYGNHENIISSTYLRPYVNGPIENSYYYFKDNNSRKQYDLDNLLLTQGWSSYNWNTISTKSPSYLFDFEKGITYTASINSNKSPVYFQYPTKVHDSETFFLKETEKIFSKDLFFPFEKEKLSFSQIEKNGKFKKPALFLQFKPSIIPKMSFKEDLLLGNKKSTIFNSEIIPNISFDGIGKLQELDEVVLLKRRTNQRIEKIKNKSFGKVDFFTSDDQKRYPFLSSYISQKGYNVSEIEGVFSISSYRPGEPPPVIYFNGILLNNYNILYRMSVRNIDYVEINKAGIGSGPASRGGGVIKIFTNPFVVRDNNTEIATSFNIPLTFKAGKRYYAPKYYSFKSNFFKNYGVIDWHPNVTIDGLGKAEFKILDTGLSQFKLFIEGLVDSEKMVSETIEVKID